MLTGCCNRYNCLAFFLKPLFPNNISISLQLLLNTLYGFFGVFFAEKLVNNVHTHSMQWK